MKRYLRMFICMTVMLTLGLMGMVTSANALQKLRLSDGATTVTITDGGGDDSNPAAGAITWIGALGAFTINVSTGLSKPSLGSASSPFMDLNSVNTSNAAGMLTISHTDTDFSSAGPSGASMNIGGTTGGSVTYTAYFDLADGEFATTTLIGTLGAFSSGGFTGTLGGPGPGADPAYSLTQVVEITHLGAAATSFNAELKVPEPDASLLLGMSLSLIGLLGYGWRRMTAIS